MNFLPKTQVVADKAQVSFVSTKNNFDLTTGDRALCETHMYSK